MNSIEVEIQEMRRKLGEVDDSIVNLSTVTLDLVSLLHAKLTNISTLARPGGGEGEIDTEDPRFIFISNWDLKQKLQEDLGLSRIVKVNGSFSISNLSRADDNHKSVLCAVDGSLMSTNSRRTAACSIIYKYNSGANFRISVPEKRSSTMPEVRGLHEAIKSAKILKIKRLTLIADSLLAIRLTHEALTTPMMSSSVLQRASQVEPALSNIFACLRSSLPSFEQLVIIHQKSHRGVIDIWSELNELADMLAKSHAKDCAMNMLPNTERHARSTSSYEIRHEADLARAVGHFQGDTAPDPAENPPLPPPSPSPSFSMPPLPALPAPPSPPRPRSPSYSSQSAPVSPRNTGGIQKKRANRYKNKSTNKPTLVRID